MYYFSSLKQIKTFSVDDDGLIYDALSAD